MTMQRLLARHGILAIDPRALSGLYAAGPAAVGKEKVDRANVIRGQAVIVRISGPLDNHASEECDSYEAILARVTEACASSARTVVLSFDSPGGVVAGCFEAAQIIRSRCAAAGKELVSYVEGRACSAAYALACAARRIVAPASAIVGSIGIIEPRIDMTRADQAMGVSFAFVTSGARKADGNPHVAFSAEELRDKQRVINALAGVFFGVVAEARSLSVPAIAGLEAREFTASAAQQLGLVDDVQTLDELLATASKEEPVSASAYERGLAAFREAAEGDGEEAAAARRAIAALEGDEEGDGETEDKKDEDESAASDAPEESAEGSDEAPAGESDDDSPAAASASVSAATAGELAATVQRLERKVASLTRGNDAAERKALFASRQITPELRKHLEGKPLAEVKLILSALPKAQPTKLAAASAAAGTRGEGRGAGERAPASDPELAKVDALMGMGQGALAGSTYENHILKLGVAPLAKKGG